MSENSQYQVNLLDLFAFLVRWRKFLISAVLCVAVIVGAISFILPPKYRSKAVIRPAKTSQEGIGGLISSKLAAISGIAGFSALSSASGEFYQAILKSRWMSERLIEKFNLRSVYDMPDVEIDEIIKALNTRTRFEIDPSAETLVIYADDTDPKRAQQMAEFLVSEMDIRYQELQSYGARREREFTGERLDEARRKLSNLEDSLTHFQIATGVLEPQEQIRATIQAVAALEAQRLATQTELEMKDLVFGPGSDEAYFLKIKLASIDSTMRNMISRKSRKDGNNFLLNLEDSPQQGMIYLRLMRDIEIQQLLVGFLLQKFEQARLEEHRNTPSIVIVDPPQVPSKRFWPRRGLLVGISVLVSFVFGVGIASVMDLLRSASRDPNHPQHERLKKIGRNWKNKDFNEN